MLHSTRWFSRFLAVLSLGVNSAALATPALNNNGDYVGSTSIGFMKWQVVDLDPNGLNCRMASEWQPATLDSIDAPARLYENNRHNIRQWPILFSFQTGETLTAVIGNGRFNQLMLFDQQGKPWLGVRTAKGDCFVRANQRYVEPIGQPGWHE